MNNQTVIKLDHNVLLVFSEDAFYIKNQWFTDVLKNRCLEKFCKFYRKTPLLESLFNKVAGLQAS